MKVAYTNGGVLPPTTAGDDAFNITESDDRKRIIANGQEEVKPNAGYAGREEGGHENGDDEAKSTACFCRECCTKIDPKLIFYKSLFFSFHGALGIILPFIAVFLKQLGQGPLQIGIITGLRPVVGLVAAPGCGSLADRWNIRKLLLLISLVFWCAFSVGLYHLPMPTRLKECPAELKPHRGSVHTNVRKRDTRRDGRNYPTNLQENREMLDLFKRNVDTQPSDIPEFTTVASSLNQSWRFDPEQVTILQENIHWIYEPSGVKRAFGLSMLLIFGEEIVKYTSTALADAGLLRSLGMQDLSWYGAQRAWGAIGWATGAFLAGGVVSSSRQNETVCGIKLHFSDYRLLSYVFIAFMVLAFISACRVSFKEGKGEECVELKEQNSVPSHVDDKEESGKRHSALAVLKLFCNVHYGSWLCTVIFMGVCNGVIWGFLYWHLENLGGSQLLMGVDSIVTCTSEFITFYFVDRLIQKIGHMGILYLALVSYVIRFIIYGVISNPWTVLPAGLLQGFTFSCTWVSMTSYTAAAVPAFSFATIQGIMHGVYFGLGTGTGNLLGGILIGAYGARVTFFAFAVACVVILLIFVIVQWCSTAPTCNYTGYSDLDQQSLNSHDPAPTETRSNIH